MLNAVILAAGNYIAASAAYVTFNWETQGSSLAVLPLGWKREREIFSVETNRFIFKMLPEDRTGVQYGRFRVTPTLSPTLPSLLSMTASSLQGPRIRPSSCGGCRPPGH